MLRYAYTTVLFLFYLTCKAQGEKLCIEREGLPKIGVAAGLKGISFDKALYVSKKYFEDGFSLSLSDSSYRITGFEFYYDQEDGDICHKIVCGGVADIKTYPILTKLKKGEIFDFTSINVERDGKRFITDNFLVYLAD